jgi:hypothetical protein
MDGVDKSALAWLNQLPEQLGAQRRLLERLLGWCEADDDVRWLTVGCSLERGNADALSDLDLAMGVGEDAQGEVLERVQLALPSFGELVECFDNEVEVPRLKLRHVFAQYADRTQLDVNITFAAPAHIPRVVVLYDPENLVTVLGDDALDPKRDEVCMWAFESWVALANVGKYLRRSSFWEAERELELARANLFRLWALAEHVAHARYGVSALLDAEGAALPPGIEGSLPGDDLSELLRAAVYLAEQLTAVQDRLDEEHGYGLPATFAHFVRDDLASI